MYYIYELFSLKDRMLYTGYADNIKCRINEHNRGLVSSGKHRRPLELIYQEFGGTKEDAIRRVRCLKSRRGKKYIRTRLTRYTEDIKL